MIIALLTTALIITAIAVIINLVEDVNKQKSKISFKEAMDLVELPVVTFYQGDKKLNFLLDTGSNLNHINASELKSLDYVMGEDKTNVIGMEGNTVLIDKCVMSISYKNKEYKDTFLITDLEAAFSGIKTESGVQLHGILGSKFFEKYKYVLNFAELTLYNN